MRSLLAVAYAAMLTLIFTILTKQVSSSGVFKLDLTQFNNDLGLNADGNCCNGIKRPGTNGRCDSSCRTFFRICLKHFQYNITTDAPCTYGEVISPALGTNSFTPQSTDNFNVPIQIPFKFSWPGTFSLIVEAWHDTTLTGPIPGSPRELIYRLAVQKAVQVGQDWSHGHGEASTGARLDYRYQVTCDPNYYGAGCSNLCKPRSDQFGHYTCSENGTRVCLEGWTGKYCDTALCLPGCHSVNGKCDQPNECKCSIGWQGTFCDECIPYPGCGEHGSCAKPFDCICEEGWGGLFCTQDLNYCTHHMPCENGGTCMNTGQGSYTCTCPSGFTGTNCEIEIDDCQHNPCENGGTCQDIGAGYQCMCQQGFHGQHCQHTVTGCTDQPCQNAGTCRDVGETYKCMCRNGYTGVNCEVEINECKSNPCMNGGRCIDELNGFRCMCPAGFYGEYCNLNYNNCANSPCQNGGTCIDGENDFTCRCVPGFIGALCQENIDDCVYDGCANGATCIDLVNDFSCTCAPGFTGRFCTENIDDCTSQPCQNGGTCKDKVDTYKCECMRGFYGDQCQYSPGNGPTTTTSTKSTDQNTPLVNVEDNETSKEPDAGELQSKEEDLTMEQMVLIVCFGAGIPIVLIIIVVVILLCRKPKRHNKETEQNEANSMNNKCIDANIINSFPASTLYKLKNEEQDSKSIINSKQHNLEKSSNKLQKDLNELNGDQSDSIDLKKHQQYKIVDSDAISIDTVIDISEHTDVCIVKPINKDNSSSFLYLDKHHPHHPTPESGMLATEV